MKREKFWSVTGPGRAQDVERVFDSEPKAQAYARKAAGQNVGQVFYVLCVSSAYVSEGAPETKEVEIE